ncbi:hypothetical protein DID75_05535 [Candidatus Marinamargulisbacteria bacterium SCGC AG-410-N11]|nr:hypothetical protein DID75_05535 [Candidatus Marinamargulisbacteria bacterium SCGC AG-410-N11]
MLMRLCLVVIFFVLSIGSLYANPIKLAMEQNLTEMCQNALDSLCGKDNFVVKVQVAITDPEYVVKYTEQSSPKMKKSSKAQKQVYILPGVPALKNLSPDALNKLPYDSTTTLSKTRIRRIMASVFYNKSRKELKKQSKEARKLVEQILDIKKERGDKVDVRALNLKQLDYNPAKTPQLMQLVPGKEKIFSFKNILDLLLLLLFILFIGVYAVLQLKSAKKEGEDSGGGGGAPGVNVSVNPNIELPKGGGGGGAGGKMSMSSSSMKTYYDFVDDDNIDNFIFLLKKEKLPVTEVSSILSFLSPDLAVKVLDKYTIPEQSKMTVSLLEEKLANRDKLEKLEKKLKGAIECFTGGQARFVNVIDLISGKNKKKILDTLQKSDPKGFKAMRPHVVVFDDLLQLEDEELSLILSDANLELIATALVSVDQSVYNKFDDNLTASGKAMVSQYLELKGENTSSTEIESAQDYVIKLAKKLDESGKIKLKK